MPTDRPWPTSADHGDEGVGGDQGDQGDENGMTRRGVLLGGAAAVAGVAGAGWLVEQDLLPGRSQAYSVLGLNGDGAPVPDVEPGRLVTGSFVSRARGGVEVGWAVSYPVGTSLRARLPVLLVLHGASGDSRTAFEGQALDRFRTLVVTEGVPPFAVAAVDGGDGGWRPQPDGTDPSRMLLEEFLPRLAERRLDVDRVALHGWSLGGYGALRLAGLDLLPVRAVTASSPALDAVPADASEDDDVLGHPGRLDGVPVRIDCGRGDPFYPVVRDFVAALADLDPPPESSFGAGGHTGPYWRTVAPAQLRFAGERLA